jgi:hypothetical protein
MPSPGCHRSKPAVLHLFEYTCIGVMIITCKGVHSGSPLSARARKETAGSEHPTLHSFNGVCRDVTMARELPLRRVSVSPSPTLLHFDRLILSQSKTLTALKTTQSDQLTRLQAKNQVELDLLDDIRNFAKQRSNIEKECAQVSCAFNTCNHVCVGQGDSHVVG